MNRHVNSTLKGDYNKMKFKMKVVPAPIAIENYYCYTKRHRCDAAHSTLIIDNNAITALL